MTIDGWRLVIHNAHTHEQSFELLATLLYQQDMAKAELHRRGYGVTGTPWPDVVKEIPHAGSATHIVRDLSGVQVAQD